MENNTQFVYTLRYEDGRAYRIKRRQVIDELVFHVFPREKSVSRNQFNHVTRELIARDGIKMIGAYLESVESLGGFITLFSSYN